eukprot:gene3142-2124_t
MLQTHEWDRGVLGLHFWNRCFVSHIERFCWSAYLLLYSIVYINCVAATVEDLCTAIVYGCYMVWTFYDLRDECGGSCNCCIGLLLGFVGDSLVIVVYILVLVVGFGVFVAYVAYFGFECDELLIGTLFDIELLRGMLQF